jgi:hypothetical protein
VRAVLPRRAVEAGDAGKSKALHDALAAMPKEQHGGAGSDRIKSIVFGGLDGIITTFSIVAAVVRAPHRIATWCLSARSSAGCATRSVLREAAHITSLATTHAHTRACRRAHRCPWRSC